MNTSHLFPRKRASFFTGSVLRAVLGLALAFPAFLAPAIRADSKTDSQKQFERAVKMRTMLEGYLERDRGESDYKQTVLAYRKVYLITPTAPDATQALIAEAELYQAMGRLFDPKYFQEAIDRYNFLLKQYPGTRFRQDSKRRSKKTGRRAGNLQTVPQALPARGQSRRCTTGPEGNRRRPNARVETGTET
jgi:hypothetical protein